MEYPFAGFPDLGECFGYGDFVAFAGFTFGFDKSGGGIDGEDCCDDVEVDGPAEYGLACNGCVDTHPIGKVLHYSNVINGSADKEGEHEG